MSLPHSVNKYTMEQLPLDPKTNMFEGKFGVGKNIGAEFLLSGILGQTEAEAGS